MSRLFFALWPEPAVRAGMTAIMERLPAGCGRLVRPENLHITLVFLGSVSRNQEQCVVNGAQGIQVTPITLTLDTLDWWQRPQVLWLGSKLSPASLTLLAGELKALAHHCGIRTDARPFAPHATLARKVDRRVALTISTPVTWPISAFALVRSETRPEGPRYEVIWTSTG